MFLTSPLIEQAFALKTPSMGSTILRNQPTSPLQHALRKFRFASA